MKELFILSSGQFLYGANRSISGLLKNVDYEYDIMICKGFTSKVDEDLIRSNLGSNLKNIYVCWLPRYRCHSFDKNGFISELSHYINNCMAFIMKRKKDRIIKQEGYDIVHLNSLVLYPLIKKDRKYIIHAREIINPKYRWISLLQKHMKNAAGVIYIDEATKESVETYVCCKNRVMINNPFDMSSVGKLNYDECLNKLKIPKDHTVFSMLGQIGKSKGSDFVVEAFHQNPFSNTTLLVVGNYEHKFGKALIEHYKDDKRIRFCGEYQDTAPIFRISDYILRGEEQFCIGRTIYEGLYSGCGAIIPGNNKDLESIVEHEMWEEDISFYEPGNQSELTKQISMCSNKKRGKRKYYNNINKYVVEYHDFLNVILT